METPISKRLVIEMPDRDHRAIKACATEAGESISGFVRGAIHAELERRRRLLTRRPRGSADPR